MAAEKSMDGVTDLVNTIERVHAEVSKTGSVDSPCVNCISTIEADQKILLSDKIVDLGRPFIYKDNVPYTIHIKRTKDSPLRSTLKFKNGHSACGKMFAESNPWVSGGALVIGCAYTMTVFEDNEIELDLKKFPLPLDNEEQIIEIKITKPNSSNSFYSLETAVLKGPSAKTKVAKKFWGEGYNLDFQESRTEALSEVVPKKDNH